MKIFLRNVLIISILFLFFIHANCESDKSIDNIQDFDVTTLENESFLNAVLWHQTSAEYRALAYQAYNLAKLRLDEDLEIERERKRAIIADIDETVLDNSAYNAKGIVEKQSYPEDFYEWIDRAEGRAVPGAVKFLNYAVEKGCDIFYISNRRTMGLDGTMRNLKKLGFPQVEKNHVLLKETTSNKGLRRDSITKTHDIVLLLGDNLIDFDDIFRGISIEERYSAVDKIESEFGKKFIIFPNSMHGEWIKALYNYDRTVPFEERKQKMVNHLRTY